MREEKINKNLEKSAYFWVNKALIQNRSNKKLDKLKNNIDAGINIIKDDSKSNVDSTPYFTKAIEIIKSFRKEDFNDELYYRTIVNGGDGSSYESSIYRDVGEKNLIGVLNQIQLEAKNSSKINY